MTNTPANSVTVTEAGTYELSYNAILSPSSNGPLTLAVRQNGTEIPSTAITRTTTPAGVAVYSGDAIVTLNANDVLDLALTSAAADTVTLGTGVNAALTVKRLD